MDTYDGSGRRSNKPFSRLSQCAMVSIAAPGAAGKCQYTTYGALSGCSELAPLDRAGTTVLTVYPPREPNALLTVFQCHKNPARFKGVVAQLSLRAACTQSPTATRTGEGWLIVQWVTPVGTFVVHIRPDVEHFWETIKQTPPAPVSDDPPSYVCRPLDVDKIDRSFSAFAHGAFTGAVVPWFRGMQTFVQLVRLATKLARIPVGDISFPSVCCGGTDGKSLGSLLQVVGALAAAYACSAVLQPDDKSDANTGPVPLSVDATTGAAQGAVGDCEDHAAAWVAMCTLVSRFMSAALCAAGVDRMTNMTQDTARAMAVWAKDTLQDQDVEVALAAAVVMVNYAPVFALMQMSRDRHAEHHTVTLLVLHSVLPAVFGSAAKEWQGLCADTLVHTKLQTALASLQAPVLYFDVCAFSSAYRRMHPTVGCMLQPPKHDARTYGGAAPFAWLVRELTGRNASWIAPLDAMLPLSTLSAAGQLRRGTAAVDNADAIIRESRVYPPQWANAPGMRVPVALPTVPVVPDLQMGVPVLATTASKRNSVQSVKLPTGMYMHVMPPQSAAK